MDTTRKPYPSDVSDTEWDFLLPYLTLMREDAPQRSNDLREVYDALRYVVKTGCQWRQMPHDFPAWFVVYQQARRWFEAGVFEEVAHDLRVILRLVNGRDAQPSAAILDGRTLQSTPESGARAGYDGAKKKNGSKVPIAVDTMGNLLALKVTAANEQERAPVAELAAKRQEVTGGTVEIAFVDQGDTGGSAAEQASGHGIERKVVKHTEAKKGFVLLPRRWAVGDPPGFVHVLGQVVEVQEQRVQRQLRFRLRADPGRPVHDPHLLGRLRQVDPRRQAPHHAASSAMTSSSFGNRIGKSMVFARGFMDRVSTSGRRETTG